MLCHGAGTIVGGTDGDGLDHVGNGHGLPYLQINLAAALGCGGFRCGDGIVPVDFP